MQWQLFCRLSGDGGSKKVVVCGPGNGPGGGGLGWCHGMQGRGGVESSEGGEGDVGNSGGGEGEAVAESIRDV